MITVVFVLGSATVGLAQMKGMMHGGKGMMMGQSMDQPMLAGMCGMGGFRMVAVEDGGIVVMSAGKLYKYDKDLNLKKQIEIPVDLEHMKKMQMQIKDMWMTGDTEKTSE